MKVKITSLRQHIDGKLLAFCDVLFEDIGLTVRDMRIMQGPKRLFASFPSTAYTGKDGEDKYKNIVFIEDKEKYFDAQHAIIHEYNEMIEEEIVEATEKVKMEDNIPF